MRREETPGPDGEIGPGDWTPGSDPDIGPGDWNSGPWGPSDGSTSGESPARRKRRGSARSRGRFAARSDGAAWPDGAGPDGVDPDGVDPDGVGHGGAAWSGGMTSFDESEAAGQARPGFGLAGDPATTVEALRAEIRERETQGEEPTRGRRRRGGGRGESRRDSSRGAGWGEGRRDSRGDGWGEGRRDSRGEGRGDSRRGSRRERAERERAGGWLPDGPSEGSPASQGPEADPEAVARAICLRLLTMAPKTRAQLAEALRKRDVPEDAANPVLERFSEVGLIDDEAFAAAWVSSRHAGRGLARRALAQELRHRGVAEETVKDAVARLDSDQEAETARRLVDRKLAATRGVEPQARMRRLVGMLARKGYPPGLAFRVVREALEAEGCPSDGLPETFE